MAKSSKLRVMISSRCNDPFPAGQTVTTLSVIRRELKAEIEAMEIAGRPAFEVWINEDAPPGGGRWDSWDTCIDAVKDCDILLVLSNGNAGWAQASGDVGICHAELMTGLAEAPAKIRLIQLEINASRNGAEGARNQRFQAYVEAQSLFRGGSIETQDDLRARVKEAIHDAVVSLTQAGVRDAAKGKFHSGAALDWSRLDFASRERAMISAARDTLAARVGAVEGDDRLFVRLNKQDVLFVVHAIPAALSVAAARERVGQPFLRDHQSVAELTGKRGGPVHLIVCHKTATESQAARLLGFPDATLVAAPFGIFAADPVQKVQFAFVTNCRDETCTRHGVQRFLEWLTQTGEDRLLVERAQARARIVRAIAKESSA